MIKIRIPLPKIFGGGGSIEQGPDYGTGLPPFDGNKGPKPLRGKKLDVALEKERVKLEPAKIVHNPEPTAQPRE